MPSRDFKYRAPSYPSHMVREDIEDFISMLHRTFPGIVFFSGWQNRKGNFKIFDDPYACMKAYENDLGPLDLTFRWPYKKERKDGRPEVLSGGRHCPASREFDDLQWAGRWGRLRGVDVPYFAHATIPVNATDEFLKERRWDRPPYNRDRFDSDDLRKLRAQPDWHFLPRIFHLGNNLPPALRFTLDIGDPEKIAFAKEVRHLWDSLSIKTTVRRHLVTDEIVRVESSSSCGTSKRIVDACAFDENLYITFYSGSERYPCFGERPTDAYIAKARKRTRLGPHKLDSTDALSRST